MVDAVTGCVPCVAITHVFNRMSLFCNGGGVVVLLANSPLGLTAEERLLLGSSDDDNDNDRSAYAPKSEYNAACSAAKVNLGHTPVRSGLCQQLQVSF